LPNGSYCEFDFEEYLGEVEIANTNRNENIEEVETGENRA
jgi:hypothetical protein